MPPNQLAQVMSCTPGMLLICSAWLVGIENISEVDRSVTMRVEELPSAPALNVRTVKTTARASATSPTTNEVTRSAWIGPVTGAVAQAAVESRLKALEQAARGADNLMPQILAACEALATVGEISDRLRNVFGEYREAS